MDTDAADRRFPVTTLSSLRGSRKTTLLKEVRNRHREGRRVAVIIRAGLDTGHFDEHLANMNSCDGRQLRKAFPEPYLEAQPV